MSDAFSFCSPSRSAFLTGRLPVHVNDQNAEPTVRNAADPIGGYAGIPVNMTSIAAKMGAAGYATHMTGKWDAGMVRLASTRCLVSQRSREMHAAPRVGPRGARVRCTRD